jgi:hypothetical protein
VKDLNEQDLNNLKHMLGATSHTLKKNWGYRNRFMAGGNDLASMERLQKQGLVRRINKNTSIFPDPAYVATEEGCKHLRFNKKQIANAMDF